MNLAIIGLIVSGAYGVYRIGKAGKELLSGTLPKASKESDTARSLMPGPNYPDVETLLKRAKKQQEKGMAGVVRR